MKEKRTCNECGRRLRKRCFIYNRVKDKKICRQCNNRIGTNPFYTNEPIIRGAKKKFQKKRKPIGKIEQEEKIVLLEGLKRKGISRKQCWDRINKTERFVKKTNKNNLYKKEIKQKENILPKK
ncbi:MAG: hypothetical protein ACOC3Z_01985 [Nanoarchaeota archaeon]